MCHWKTLGKRAIFLKKPSSMWVCSGLELDELFVFTSLKASARLLDNLKLKSKWALASQFSHGGSQSHYPPTLIPYCCRLVSSSCFLGRKSVFSLLALKVDLLALCPRSIPFFVFPYTPLFVSWVLHILPCCPFSLCSSLSPSPLLGTSSPGLPGRLLSTSFKAFKSLS